MKLTLKTLQQQTLTIKRLHVNVWYHCYSGYNLTKITEPIVASHVIYLACHDWFCYFGYIITSITTITNVDVKIPIEIDENKTVLELKQQIESKKGSDYAVGCQKLIYSGKILSDDVPLKDYKIEENKFIFN